MRSLTTKTSKRNEKTGEYQSGQMGQTVNLLVYTFGGSNNEKTGEYQSGQMGQTVNLLVYTFGGSNPSSPTKPERKKRK